MGNVRLVTHPLLDHSLTLLCDPGGEGDMRCLHRCRPGGDQGSA